MAVYRKKPIEIEAVKLTNENAEEVAKWCGGRVVKRVDTNQEYVAIDTIEGTMHARPGNYVVKGVAGEFYPCKAEIFEQTHEAVNPESEATDDAQG